MYGVYPRVDPYQEWGPPPQVDRPDQWVSCKAGEPAPSSVLVAPDQFASYVCMWPGKDKTLGRGKDNLHMHGLDAWFPYGGVEWSASKEGFTFQVLVDDGTIPGLYSWIEIHKWIREKDTLAYTPVVINEYSPIIINDNLGKGNLDTLDGWTGYGGKETHHDKATVRKSLVLCRRRIGYNPGKYREWRELVIAPRNVGKKGHYGRGVGSGKSVFAPYIKYICTQKSSKQLCNETDTAQIITVELTYQSEEGQRWQNTTGMAESTNLETVIKSEAVTGQLLQDNYVLGKALYGSTVDRVEQTKATIRRSYTVPPRTEMIVQLNIHKESCELDCTATENVFNKDGHLILTRSVGGRWYGVTTTEIKVEITEKPAVKGLNPTVNVIPPTLGFGAFSPFN